MNLELFCSSGGLAEGFRRAGIHFDLAFDVDLDACASYETNLGRRPVRMDVRDLLRMVHAGWMPTWMPTKGVDLLVADPPCTPWSPAGKRRGVADPRDMLLPTIELIRLLRPRRYLIANVPGLDDARNWPVVQGALAPLISAGYCVADYAALDAAFYGVPQRRRRPFWFGHRQGPCISWPSPTHGDPKDPSVHAPLPGLGLQPWVTCREALGHLSTAELGRPVRLRSGRFRDNGTEHEYWSHVDDPAKVIGCHPTSRAGTTLALFSADGSADVAPRKTTRLPQSQRVQRQNEPARTVRGSRTGGAGQLETGTEHRRRWERHPASRPDEPAFVVGCRDRAHSGTALEWPWDQPSTTGACNERIAPPGHKPDSWRGVSSPDAVILSERAASLLQGFPAHWTFVGKTKESRWSQIGQALPPALAEAVGRAVAEQLEAQESRRGELEVAS